MISSVKTIIVLTEISRTADEQIVRKPYTLNIDYFAGARYMKFQKSAHVLVGQGGQYEDTTQVSLGTGEKIIVVETATEIAELIHKAQRKNL